MSQIHFLTPEQEALIPEYQEKWKQFYLSTQPIERSRAEAAIKGAYAVMGKKEPDVVFCPSPKAALEHLQNHVSAVKIPQESARPSQEEIERDFLKFFARSAWEAIKFTKKQQCAGSKPLFDLIQAVSLKPGKSLAKHIDRLLPKDLSTQDVIEQAFLGANPLFNQMGKHMSRHGDPETAQMLQDRQPEDMQDSFRMTADALGGPLGQFPGTGLFLRAWLKQMLQGTLAGKISGLDHPQFRNAVFQAASHPEMRFLAEHPPLASSELAVTCIWLDFAFTVLEYSYKSQQWAAVQGLAKHCGWIFVVNNICVVCDRPTHIRLNEDNQLHGEGEPALQFADGFAVYANHGTPLQKKYGEVHPREWHTHWILEESNKNIRELLARGIGAVRISQEFPTVVVDSTQNDTLLKLEGVGAQDAQILKRTHSETGAIQAVFVPWSTRSVKDAIEYAQRNFSEQDFPLSDDESEV